MEQLLQEIAKITNAGIPSLSQEEFEDLIVRLSEKFIVDLK